MKRGHANKLVQNVTTEMSSTHKCARALLRRCKKVKRVNKRRISPERSRTDNRKYTKQRQETNSLHDRLSRCTSGVKRKADETVGQATKRIRLGEMVGEAAKTVRLGEMVGQAAKIVRLGETVVQAAKRMRLGETVGQGAKTVRLRERVGEAAKTVRLGGSDRSSIKAPLLEHTHVTNRYRNNVGKSMETVEAAMEMQDYVERGNKAKNVFEKIGQEVKTEVRNVPLSETIRYVEPVEFDQKSSEAVATTSGALPKANTSKKRRNKKKKRKKIEKPSDTEAAFRYVNLLVFPQMVVHLIQIFIPDYSLNKNK